METRARGEETSREKTTQPLSQLPTEPAEVVQAHLRAIEEKNFDKARQLLSNDFTFTGATPQPIGIDQYMQIHQNLLSAFKDWKYNLSIEKEQGDLIQGEVQITGTHTGALNLPFLPGVQNVQPTRRQLAMPTEPVKIRVQNGKITQLDVKQVPNGGVTGILSQIGVQVQH